MGRKGFKDLVVWQKAKDLAVYIYRSPNGLTKGLDLSLKDQVRRSAVSVASNLAEGDERGTDKESIRYFFIAKGSVAEIRTQLQIACESGNLESKIYDYLESEYESLGMSIGSLIRARRRSLHP